MAKPSKKTANMAKHLTKAEMDARQSAEASMTRSGPQKPRRARKLITGDKAARVYWDSIWAQAEELDLLDVIDEYALAGLCSQLAMRDRLAVLTPALLDRLDQISADELDDEALNNLASCLKNATALSNQRMKVDSQILAYAEKLGLTPSGRARLAVRKAEADAVDPDDDLFG